MIYVTFQDAVKTPEAPKNPTRILGLDPGLDNFLTALTNFPSAPFILDGHWLKSINQNFNRKRAVLMSELTRGLDSTKSVKNSARLNRISKTRSRGLTLVPATTSTLSAFHMQDFSGSLPALQQRQAFLSLKLRNHLLPGQV